MYEPSIRQSSNLALLWPALAAAAASDMAASAAKRWVDLAVGPGRDTACEPQWTTSNSIALELQTVRLRDFATAKPKTSATLLCAPFALHGAVIADLAPGHSLVATLRAAGVQRLFVTDWRSAKAPMRFLGVDHYLADLNVLVDEIGVPVDLVGLCQGGWLALVYAARFPAKVHKLVLAGAPIDIAAASSALSVIADASPLAMFRELVRLGDGLLPGHRVLKFWAPQSVADEDIRDILQTSEPIGSEEFAKLGTLFRAWYGWTVDLPGHFFLETVEKLYKRNALATGGFVALGQRIDLGAVKLPMFLLAARDDELVPPPQVFAAERLVGTGAHELRKAIAPCRHVGLFAGKRTLEDIWPGIVRWLGETATDKNERMHLAGIERVH
jgi:poly(3-hydroxybutyrate) depolymerase